MATKSLVKPLIRQVFSAIVFVAAAGFFNTTTYASEDIPDVLMLSFFDEFRFGVQYNDFRPGGERKEAGVNLNAEVLFRRPNIYYDNQLLLFLFNPRLHIGASLNTAGDTSQAYAGLTYDYRLTNNFFVEASFGGVIHDGNLKNSAVPGAVRALGCRTMFRQSVSAGYEFTESMRIMITLDTINNFGLCSENAGLSTLGARIGYKF